MANETETSVIGGMPDTLDPPTWIETLDYLSTLNDAQRSAVEHGEGGIAEPLLIIAGAGSGST